MECYLKQKYTRKSILKEHPKAVCVRALDIIPNGLMGVVLFVAEPKSRVLRPTLCDVT